MLDFVSKYKIIFTPYILINEFQKDKSIGWKRYLYLKKLFKRDLKTKYKIYFYNKTVRRETIGHTGLWYSLINIK